MNDHNDPRPVPVPFGKDPLTQLFESMGSSFEHMKDERDSPKGRAWDLLCACARRAPVDEKDVARALELSDEFERLWAERQAARTIARAEAGAAIER